MVSVFRQIVGNLLYYRYMNPAIVAPDGFDIIDMTAGGQLHSDQRRNLGSVAKMLQHAAANKLFEGENMHMTSMNTYISQTYQKFRWDLPVQKRSLLGLIQIWPKHIYLISSSKRWPCLCECINYVIEID